MHLKLNPNDRKILVFVLLSLLECALSSPSLIRSIQQRQTQACLVDKSCDNCWKTVEKILSQEKLGHRDVSTPPEPFMEQCSIPVFKNIEQYCCQMWETFDCRSLVAKKHCDVVSYVKLHKNMVDWANSLMLMNVCTDFDYNSRSCNRDKLKRQTR